MFQRLRRFFRLSLIIGSIALTMMLGVAIDPAQATPDPYIAQYLKVQPGQSADVKQNPIGATQTFDYLALLKGKELFGKNCQSCHVGGSTLASPDLPLSLVALQGATPPRDSIDALVTYMRQPLGYTGEDDNYGCREIKESWLNQEDVSAIAAFVLRAASIAPGWGTKDF